MLLTDKDSSQILQLLLELNDSPEVPGSLRYDLKGTGYEGERKPERHQDVHAAHEALRLGRYRVQKGDQSVDDYEESKKDLIRAVEFAPAKSYAKLAQTCSIEPVSYDITVDPSIPTGAGYLTLRQEEQYLQSIDSFMSGKNSNPRVHAINSLGSRTAERTADRERETQLKNPVSVYNWLRKHQPQVFLQDHETSNEKGSKVSGSRSSKRTAVKDAKQEQDYYDEDGIALEYSSTSRGKRKRNDDGAFRPKGGKSGHPPKRRKEDSGRRSKRSSMDARIS